MAKKQHRKNTKKNENDLVIDDPRFARVQYDPRFQRRKKNAHKVTLDERFSRVMTDKEFSGKGELRR
jgi:hypothetical protein